MREDDNTTRTTSRKTSHQLPKYQQVQHETPCLQRFRVLEMRPYRVDLNVNRCVRVETPRHQSRRFSMFSYPWRVIDSRLDVTMKNIVMMQILQTQYELLKVRNGKFRVQGFCDLRDLTATVPRGMYSNTMTRKF